MSPPTDGARAPSAGLVSFTNNSGRARHSVRAVVRQTARAAGRGLPTRLYLPALFVKGMVPPLGQTGGRR